MGRWVVVVVGWWGGGRVTILWPLSVFIAGRLKTEKQGQEIKARPSGHSSRTADAPIGGHWRPRVWSNSRGLHYMKRHTQWQPKLGPDGRTIPIVSQCKRPPVT